MARIGILGSGQLGRMLALAAHPLGTLVAGDKKDIVLTPQHAAKPGKVAIYGWHRTNGVAIQPLYLGHADSWADYSHGVRLVHQTAKLDGADKPIAELLADHAMFGEIPADQRAHGSFGGAVGGGDGGPGGGAGGGGAGGGGG